MTHGVLLCSAVMNQVIAGLWVAILLKQVISGAIWDMVVWLWREKTLLPGRRGIGSWTPTFTLFILFKKLYPDSTIKEFYKNAFKERLN